MIILIHGGFPFRSVGGDHEFQTQGHLKRPILSSLSSLLFAFLSYLVPKISPGCSLEGLMLKLKLQYLATWCEELTHLKRLWCWERLRAGGEGDDRGWDDWMASLTQWTWVWVNSGGWWWTGKPGVLQPMGSQRVGHDWVTELNW